MNRRRQLSLFCLLLACVATVLSAKAETIWVDTGATIDTVVADVATAVPLNPLAPLAAAVPFKGFRYPHVDETENVTFIADDPVYIKGGAHHGIFRSFAADGQVQMLVSQDDLIPGTNRKYDLIRGLQTDEKGVDFLFNATGNRVNERGLFLWSGGKVTTIARAGVTVLPGDDAPLSDVHWGALSGGRILYTAQDAAKRSVMVLQDVKTGAVRVLLRSGMAIPGHPEKTFRYIAHQNWLSTNGLVFRASAVDADTGAPAQEGRTGVYGWFNVHWDDPATLDPSLLVTLADANTALPTPDSGNFSDFFSTPIKGGIVAFQGGGPKGRGIFYSKDGAVHSIVDSETQMDGLVTGKFTGFGIWPAVTDNGVVFTAYAKGFRGVFFYRVDQDTLYLLADNREKLEGKDIEWFEIGGRPMVGHRFAVTAHFVGGGSGIYLATIPAHAFKRRRATDGVIGER